MKKLGNQRFSIFLLAAFAAFLAYYLYRAFGALIPFSFTDPNLWEHHWMVRGDVTIPMWLRSLYFFIWSVSIIFTGIMIVWSMYLVNLVRQGEHFSLSMIVTLKRIGLAAIGSGFTIMFASSLWPWMITFLNVEEKKGITFAYDSSQAGLMLLGGGLVIMSWVLKGAFSMYQENKEII